MISMQFGLAATASLNWLIIVSGAQAENCSLRSTPSASAACFGAGLAGERRAVAGVAAHLHVHDEALADRVGRRRRRRRARPPRRRRPEALRQSHVRSSLCVFGPPLRRAPPYSAASRPNAPEAPQAGEERLPALRFVDVEVEDDGDQEDEPLHGAAPRRR